MKSVTKIVGNAGTPLHQAVGKGHKDIVSLLLNEGCPFSVVSSALHYAAQCGQIDMIGMLAEQGLDVNIGDDKGLTPLHYAAAYDQLESVRTLLRLGGRESMTKVAGLHGTPLHQAVEKGHKDIVSLLLNEDCPINVVDSKGRTVLHHAAQGGQIHMIEMLAEQRLDVNIGDDEGVTPLHVAAASGQLESVCTLLRLGGRESMTKVAGAGGTPLHQALIKGHKYMVSLLLNEGCPINVVGSALHCAVQFGQIHMIEILAEQGLDVNIGDDEGWTPLHNAAAYGRLESVRTLLRLGGRESMTKVAGTHGTPLHQAVERGHKDIVSLLLNEGCPINVVDSEGRSVLHYAAECGQIDMIEMLAEQGLNVNIGDDEGWTPLHYAATHGQLESVCTLLRLGGRESMTKVVGTGGTPLHQAVAKGHKDIVLLLLNEGCPINVVNSEGKSALHFAARYGQIHMIEILAEQGLDVNKGDNEGMTPLHHAAACGELESVRTLLRCGGNESMTKVAGKHGTPLHQAVALGHKDIVSLLLNEGCPIHVVDSEGGSVFHFAARGCQIDMIEMLAEQGLNVNKGDDEGLTPLHYAAERGHITTFNELISIGGNVHHMDNFGMKCSDYILIMQDFVTVIQFCVACGLECDDEDLLGVITALSANNLLDMNRILCLAAVRGDISLFDAMVTSQHPLNQQKMPNIAIRLSSLSGGKKLPDQFHVSEEPLNPLHISILSEYFSISWNIKFIEKLTSHPRTRYTVNEFFPNGLSPLDVARRFELHDIAVIIESAGGGPGAWAGLPTELEDKSIDIFKSLKELRVRELGKDATSRILSLLGYQLHEGGSFSEARKKLLGEKPVLYLLEKHFLLYIKSKGKWKRVGCLLKVDEDTLKRISEKAADDDDDAYYTMLEYWLENGHNVSWKTLFDAVGHFETKKIVDDITDKIVEELAPSQERSVAPSPSSQSLIQSGPTLDRPLQLIDTLGGQSTSSNSDPLTSTSETHPFDVFEQLLESSRDPQCGAIIDKYKDKFLACMDARAIVRNLEIKKIIPDTVSHKIQQSASSEANEVLFLHLRSHSSLETLHKLCDVMISTSGYPKMNELGRFMKDNLPTCGAIIENYKGRFLSYIHAHAIVKRLEIEKVIPDNVSHKIQQSAASVANEVLFLHLRSHSSPETLHKLCDVMISLSGYPKMNELGRFMKDNLPTIFTNVIPAEESRRTYNKPVKPPRLAHNQDLERDPTLTEDRLICLVGKKMDAKWEMFATHLRVERNVREGIHSQFLGDVRFCFSAVTGRWLSGEVGTGDLPRTWDTVFDALKEIGYPLLVQDVKDALAENQLI